MRREGIRLSRRHQVWVYAAFGVLFLSGALWLPFHFGGRSQGEFGTASNPAEPWLLKVHGAAAMVTLIVLGSLLPGHVRRGWNIRRNHRSGITLLALNGLLILSGYALYYFGGEESRAVISVLHWILGLLLPALLAWHVWQGWRLRVRSPKT